MTKAVETVPAAAARRLLMAGAGLLDNPDRRATAPAVYSIIERLGFVQIDSINVVERAHHHILWARAHGYRPAVLTRLYEKERRLFEHWTHDASLIPAKWFGYWRPRFSRACESKWWRERLGADAERIIAEVLERIRAEGPLLSRDFAHEGSGSGGGGGWWEWKPQKAALEYLWRTGRLMVARREGFQKVYDLTERVIGEDADAGASGGNENGEHGRRGEAETESPCHGGGDHVSWACSTAMERLGVATVRELAGFWNAVSVDGAKRWCADAALRGEVVPVAVERLDAGKPMAAYALADWRARLKRLPQAPAAARILSPFDPAIRDRKRAQRLFGFEYQFEAFTPAAKRRYGYFVLPVLQGERFIARLDPKLDRDRGVLDVARVWWEDGCGRSASDRAALEAALDRYASFVGADRWRVRAGLRRGQGGMLTLVPARGGAPQTGEPWARRSSSSSC